MLLPEFLYGGYKDVNRNCAEIAAKLARKIPWEIATSGSLSDTTLTDGLIIMNGPYNLKGKDYHIYAFLEKIIERMSLEAKEIDDFFRQCICTPWGTLSLMSGRLMAAQHLFFGRPEWHKPFLRSVLSYFDVFVTEGRRFSKGVEFAEPLIIWESVTNLQLVLFQLGVSIEDTKSPLPAGGLPELLERYKIAFPPAGTECGA